MIGLTIMHYKILEKLSESLLRLSLVGHGGFTLHSIIIIGDLKW